MLSIPARSAGLGVVEGVGIKGGACDVHPARATIRTRNNAGSTITGETRSFMVFMGAVRKIKVQVL